MPIKNRWLTALLLSLAVSVLLFSLPFLPALLSDRDYYGLKRKTDVRELALPETDKQTLSLVFLGYLQCGTVCPKQLMNLKLLDQRLKNAPIRFVFISLDPERDTSTKLKQTMQALGERFVAVRPESMREAQNIALMLSDSAAFRPDNNGYEIDHSGFLYVVNPAQQLELVYTSTALDLDRVEQDLRLLTDTFDDRK